jgi:hypothetical protein
LNAPIHHGRAKNQLAVTSRLNRLGLHCGREWRTLSSGQEFDGKRLPIGLIWRVPCLKCSQMAAFKCGFVVYGTCPEVQFVNGNFRVLADPIAGRAIVQLRVHLERLTLFAKGNVDVYDSLHSCRIGGEIRWNGINEVVRGRADVLIRLWHETWTRSDAVLGATGTVPAEMPNASCRSACIRHRANSARPCPILMPMPWFFRFR